MTKSVIPSGTNLLDKQYMHKQGADVCLLSKRRLLVIQLKSLLTLRAV